MFYPNWPKDSWADIDEQLSKSQRVSSFAIISSKIIPEDGMTSFLYCGGRQKTLLTTFPPLALQSVYADTVPPVPLKYSSLDKPAPKFQIVPIVCMACYVFRKSVNLCVNLTVAIECWFTCLSPPCLRDSGSRMSSCNRQGLSRSSQSNRVSSPFSLLLIILLAAGTFLCHFMNNHLNRYYFIKLKAAENQCIAIVACELSRFIKYYQSAK